MSGLPQGCHKAQSSAHAYSCITLMTFPRASDPGSVCCRRHCPISDYHWEGGYCPTTEGPGPSGIMGVSLANGISPRQMPNTYYCPSQKTHPTPVQTPWHNPRERRRSQIPRCHSDIRLPLGHTHKVTGKANSTLGFLKRNLKVSSPRVKQQAYFSYVRPTLDYAAAVWDPYTAKAQHALEMVQRRAARYTLGRYGNRSSVSGMLVKLADADGEETTGQTHNALQDGLWTSRHPYPPVYLTVDQSYQAFTPFGFPNPAFKGGLPQILLLP